ncbi:MAG: hypothetical protein CMH26_01635 [Micavibrio sp.]|nr:hypothetical protein [Micavibrio sp.]|tara:strand:- start:4593 stop:4790 length:198 start_codon:yes stop_codon:yes gene_type:complete
MNLIKYRNFEWNSFFKKAFKFILGIIFFLIAIIIFLFIVSDLWLDSLEMDLENMMSLEHFDDVKK